MYVYNIVVVCTIANILNSIQDKMLMVHKKKVMVKKKNSSKSS